MKLTPLDLKQQQFAVKFRGYDCDEVDTFLEIVAADFESLIRENSSLKEKIDELQSEVGEMRKLDKELRNALLSAQQLREEIASNAAKEAQLIVKEARMKAEEIVRIAQVKSSKAEEEVQAIRKQRDLFALKLRSVIDSHLKMLEMENKEDVETKDEKGDKIRMLKNI